jgi:DNA-binding beta-propeller fold protein YncE
MRRLALLTVSILLLNFAPGAFGQKLLKGIDIGGQPGIPAANLVTNMIYVPNGGLNTLTVISGSSGSVVANIPVGPTPIAVAVNSSTNLVYVTIGAIVVVDGSSNTVTATIPVPFATVITVNPTTNLIYYESGGGVISVLDGSNNQVVATIDTGFGCCIQGFAVNSVTNRIYASEQPFTGTKQLITINGANNEFTSLALTGALSAGMPAVDSALNRIYVPDNAGGGIYIVSGSTGKVIATGLPTYTGPIALNSTSQMVANFQPTAGGEQLGFFKANTIAQVGGLVNFPPHNSPLYLLAGAKGRYYAFFSNNNNIAVVAGP